jgi:hypothetical protein
MAYQNHFYIELKILLFARFFLHLVLYFAAFYLHYWKASVRRGTNGQCCALYSVGKGAL